MEISEQNKRELRTGFSYFLVGVLGVLMGFLGFYLDQFIIAALGYIVTIIAMIMGWIWVIRRFITTWENPKVMLKKSIQASHELSDWIMQYLFGKNFK